MEETESGAAASPWIDIGKTIAEFCKANGQPVSDDIEKAVSIHIKAIDSWVASLRI